MQTTRNLELLEGEWFMPVVPGRGRPIVQLHGDPSGQTLLCAFTTREKCETGIRRWFPGAEVSVVRSLSEVNDAAVQKGLTVAVDLEDNGESWTYSNFVRAVLSPGGDA